MHTSRSPERAPSTLACAVSSTELSGTVNSSASRRSPVTSSSGICTVCSPTPGTGSRVQRGTAVNPPAKRTPRQNFRPRSPVVTVFPSRNLLISHLPGRVAGPPRVRRDVLSLHQEGVCGEHRSVAHGHAVVDEGANADRAAGADLGSTRLESAILL